MILRVVPFLPGSSFALLVLLLAVPCCPVAAMAEGAGDSGPSDMRGGVVRYVDGNSGSDQGGANDCTSAVSPCLTVGRAIDASSASDVIEIADAVYTETLTIGHSLTLNGESEQGTIIQAHPQPFQASTRVVTVSGNFQVAMVGLTIRHGGGGTGAGIFLNGAVELALDRVTLYRNQAGGNGGGILANQAGCDLSINDSSFVENVSQTNSGGGIHAQYCSITITGTDFIGNIANVGGGMQLVDGVGTATLERVGFLGNSASTQGGGMHNFRSTTEILNSVFRGNVAETDAGGGGAGGGLFSNSGSDITLVNVLLGGNYAGSTGGGIFVQSSNSPLVLINVAVVGNRAETGNGGGISAVYAGAVHNSIIWNNRDQSGTGTPPSSIWTLASNLVDYSLIQGYTVSDLGGSGNLDGSSAASNPQFTAPVSPASAPTSAGDYHPGEHSAVVNAGNNSFISGYNLDLDGFDRIIDGVVDLGPYEFGNDILFRDRFEF